MPRLTWHTAQGYTRPKKARSDKIRPEITRMGSDASQPNNDQITGQCQALQSRLGVIAQLQPIALGQKTCSGP